MQAYSDPSRENDPHSLPDLDVYYFDGGGIFDCGYTVLRCDGCGARDVALADGYGGDSDLCIPCAQEVYGAGWYWRHCFPGCMPDGGPMGPFATEAAALADAREGVE